MKNKYKREAFNKILRQLNEPAERLTIIAGPRQVGKTTLVKQVLADQGLQKSSNFLAIDNPLDELMPSISDYNQTIDVMSVPDTEWLVRKWTTARTTAQRLKQEANRGYILVLDEIQKIPRWSETVKGLWDHDRAADLDMHVVLLGSSPLLVQKGLSESLAGRYELIRLAHWSFSEMQEAFGLSLDDYIYFGGYPGSAPLMRDENRWRDYVRAALIEPSIEKDVLMMARVDKPALLRALFYLGCEYSGQEFSYTKMLGQLQDVGNTVTLAHYLELLGQAGLIVGLQKYTAQQHHLRRSSSPKLAVLNTALKTIAMGYTRTQAEADRSYWGRLVESAVGAHLWNTGYPDCQLHYWREGHQEVDFVLERGHHALTAIEVKSGKKMGSLQGLEIFAKKFPSSRTLTVGEGGIALAEFLSYPAIHWME
ncbi:MAG: ATP-binding protein [Pseudomonadota bacterium]